ncbi:MAG: hypothetical protein H0W87_10115 [Actinobacteria bacterium]|nr:hypothetical protein [Actinomycetota bacterium]
MADPLAAERVAVVVLLREEKREEAELLLVQGAPFEPERIGLERHEVFFTDQEAIFVFEATAELDLRKLLADFEAWASAAWHDVVAGPPRTAKPLFVWEAVAESDGLSFASTPGPGDSEGGDVFSPS